MGIFNDIEQLEIINALQKSLSEVFPSNPPAFFQYRGKLDGRIPRPYPGPAKEGHFWVVEYHGIVGSSVVTPGDCLIRLSRFSSDWTLVGIEEIIGGVSEKLIAGASFNSGDWVKIDPDTNIVSPGGPTGATGSLLPHGQMLYPIKMEQKTFSLLKPGLTHKEPAKPKTPATKAAPGTHKRKIILEDE